MLVFEDLHQVDQETLHKGGYGETLGNAASASDGRQHD
jgi:hypothetical protein